MKHSIKIMGFSYLLRPVEKQDAKFIIDIRLEDEKRNCFIHKISKDISLQEKWIENYFDRKDDYYFVIENIFTGMPEGLIGLYDIKDDKAEWGRWVIKKGSMSATESVDLMCQVAFKNLKLKEIYSRTIQDNISVVSFHDSIKEKRRGTLKDFFELEGIKYNAVEHYIDAEYYFSNLQFSLQKQTQMLFNRNLKILMGDFKFHHIGLACTDFEKETNVFKILGYRQKDADFVDNIQGICGRFLIADNKPEIELLKNTENSHTLDYWLNNKIKIYHFAYLVKDFDKAFKTLIDRKCKLIKPAKISEYFKKKICFFVLPNMFVIELIEE